jgi:hypothetical protein
MSAHDFVEVENRRWCLCCNLFQTKQKSAAFFPTPAKPCPRDTQYAVEKEERNPFQPHRDYR